MPRKPFADIPGQKRLDSDIREVATLLKKVADQAGANAEKRVTKAQREALLAIAQDCETLRQRVIKQRGRLWDAFG